MERMEEPQGQGDMVGRDTGSYGLREGILYFVMTTRGKPLKGFKQRDDTT